LRDEGISPWRLLNGLLIGSVPHDEEMQLRRRKEDFQNFLDARTNGGTTRCSQA